MNWHDQEDQRISNKIITKKTIHKHITVKLLKTKDARVNTGNNDLNHQ